jgi:PAS domain S-box-containing protein
VSGYQRLLTAIGFRNKFNISTKVLWIILLFCLIPLFTTSLSFYLSKNESPGVWLFFTDVKKDLYSNFWSIFGISAAIFTGILAFIDYKIRREVTITLFGLTLFSSAILDLYTLFIINELPNKSVVSENSLYFIWFINRSFYAVALLIGTWYYLKVKAKNLRTSFQKNSIIKKTAFIYALSCTSCLLIIDNAALIFDKFYLDNFQFKLFSLLPLFLFIVWSFWLLPKFMRKFKSIFSKLLILSIAPLFMAQLLMAMSTHVFDTYYNAAHYLRFISYIVPLMGIILNYVETISNEQKAIAKLDIEIKEKQKITASLLERETLLAHAEKISHLGSWELNVKTGYLKWSDELYKIYGFKDKNFEPNIVINEQIIAPEYKDKLKKELALAVTNKSSFAVEYQIVQPSGIRKYMLGQGYYLEKDDKLIGTIQDITELKQAMLKLRQNETLLREAEAVSHNGSWEWKAGDEFLLWSDEMFNIHGYLPHSIFINFKTYISFIHKDDVDEVRKLFYNANKSRTSFGISYRIVRPNGEIRHVSTTAKYNETEEGYTYLGTTQDVTELKEIQRKLEEKVNELNTSNKDLEQFAYVASHDLQEPLRKIRAFGERLKAKFNDSLSNEGQDYIDRMRNAAERMQILIDDLLRFSKATRDIKKFVSVQLHDIIKQVLADLDFTIESTGAKIEINVNQKLDVIPQQLAQVFQNLLSNSLKFIKSDIKPHIKISAKNVLGYTLQISSLLPQQQYCVIEIEDNGIGFNEEYASKIFDLFQRLHTRADYKGTGIGLAICKKIIENHAGYIYAKSEEGKGASFFIVLPINQHTNT